MGHRGARDGDEEVVFVDRCPQCGEQQISLTAISVFRLASGEFCSYVWRCPGCELLVPRVRFIYALRPLIDAGVEVHDLGWPAELDEVHTGPPITLDDVLDFEEGLGSLP